MKIHYDKDDVEMFQAHEEGRAYLKYNDAVGGDIIGLMVPDGYPRGVEEMGGPIKVYEECIRRKITWEELLNFKAVPDDCVV